MECLFVDAKMNRREAALILGVRYDYKSSFIDFILLISFQVPQQIKHGCVMHTNDWSFSIILIEVDSIRQINARIFFVLSGGSPYIAAKINEAKEIFESGTK